MRTEKFSEKLSVFLKILHIFNFNKSDQQTQQPTVTYRVAYHTVTISYTFRPFSPRGATLETGADILNHNNILNKRHEMIRKKNCQNHFYVFAQSQQPIFMKNYLYFHLKSNIQKSIICTDKLI